MARLLSVSNPPWPPSATGPVAAVHLKACPRPVVSQYRPTTVLPSPEMSYGEPWWPSMPAISPLAGIGGNSRCQPTPLTHRPGVVSVVSALTVDEHTRFPSSDIRE